MIRPLLIAVGAVLVFRPDLAPAQETPCGTALVLAMDVSRSVSAEDFRLQMDGVADAFRDEDVRNAVRATPGGIMATVMLWGDRRQQAQTTGWSHLQSDASMDVFSNAVAYTRRTFGFTLTGLGAAMRYANALFDKNPMPCRRNIIDISGDGVWNDGPRPSEVWADLPRNLTINGLVILGATPDPLAYYQEEVIGGPGAFVEVAEDFSDYAEAIKLKILRELAPSLSLLAE